jgi:hypothetical protein
MTTYGQISFYASDTFLKKSRKSKSRKWDTKFPFKNGVFSWVRGLTTSSYIAYDYTTVDIRTCRVYNCVLYIQYTYASIQCIYLILTQLICKTLTTLVFGVVHSDLSVVDLTHKHIISWRSTFCTSISIITYCMYAPVSEYVNNLFTIFKSAY